MGLEYAPPRPTTMQDQMPAPSDTPARPSARSALYRLIEAGRLAREALAMPLREAGLEAGDDAVLFLIDPEGTDESELGAALGLAPEALAPHLERLFARGLVRRQAVGPELAPGLALTAPGTRLRDRLAGQWAALEEALMGGMKAKKRKSLSRHLARFAEMLRL